MAFYLRSSIIIIILLFQVHKLCMWKIITAYCTDFTEVIFMATFELKTQSLRKCTDDRLSCLFGHNCHILMPEQLT